MQPLPIPIMVNNNSLDFTVDKNRVRGFVDSISRFARGRVVAADSRYYRYTTVNRGLMRLFLAHSAATLLVVPELSVSGDLDTASATIAADERNAVVTLRISTQWASRAIQLSRCCGAR